VSASKNRCPKAVAGRKPAAGASRGELQRLRQRCAKLEAALANAVELRDEHRDAEKKLWKLVEVGYDGVAIHTNRRLVYVSRNALRKLGFRRGREVLGRSFLDLLHPDFHELALQHIKRSEDTGEPFGPIEVRVPKPDGHLLDVEVISVPLLYDGKPSHMNLFKDLTERKRAERRMVLQRDLAIRLGAASDVASGAGFCLEAAIAASEMDCGGAYVLDDETGNLIMVAHRGLGKVFVERVTTCVAGSPKALLVMAGKPFYSEYPDPRFGSDTIERKEGLRAVAMIPFSCEGRIVGCTNIASHTRAEVPIFARDALEAMAAQVGNAVARFKAEAELQARAGGVPSSS